MTLSYDPRDLMREVLAGAKARDVRREGTRDLLDKYPGSWWNGVPGDGQFDPENAGFELVSYLSTMLVWDNPRVNVTTRRPVAQQQVAEAMQFGLNRWIMDSEFATTMEDFVVDYLYEWSIAHCSIIPHPEAYECEDPPLWPQVLRLSPGMIGWDHLCPTPRRARIIWHEWWADKDDMIVLAKRDRKKPEHLQEEWDLEAIEDLNTSNPGRSILGTQLYDRDETSVDRKQVRFISVYLPSQKLDGEPGPEQGFNGVTVVLGCSSSGGQSPSSGTIVCPPKPMFGPRWGRYVIGGTYPVADCPHPLSVMLANAGHIAQASRTGRALSDALESYSRFIVTSDTDLARLMNDGKHNGIYETRSLQDLAGKIASMEKGGPTQPMLLADELFRSRRDRAMGFDDISRGIVTGEGTATEVQKASAASGARVAKIQRGFHTFERRILKTISYDLFTNDEIVFPGGFEATAAAREQAASEGREVPEGAIAFFEGGSFVAGSGVTFDDLGLEIEPYSAERPTDQVKILRAQFYTNVLPQLAVVLPQLVAAGWKPKPILRRIGEAYAIPNLEDDVDVQKLLQASQNPVPGEDPMPRLLRDIGAVHAEAGRLGARPTTGKQGGFRGMGGQQKMPALPPPAMAKPPTKPTGPKMAATA